MGAGEPFFRRDVRVERDVPARMRDGVNLFADVYRPSHGESHPVILMRTPYDKSAALSNVGYTHPSWYASHGYLVVVQDCRGRWTSEGEFYPFRDEADDGYDTIEWVAKLPGSNGRVGMYGFSYPGATQLLPATRQPPNLVTICPGFTGSQYYEGWTYQQGAFALAFASSWANYLALDTAKRRGDDEGLSALAAALNDAPRWYWTLPLNAYPPLVGTYAPYFFDWLDHSTYDEYWRRWSIDGDYGRISVPALHLAGWYDTFLSGTVKNFVGLREGAGSENAKQGQKLLIGPWYHMPWAPIWRGTAGDIGSRMVDDFQLRWFDQFLKGRNTGVLDSPVTVFMLGEGWRDLDGWPPTVARPVDYFLHSGGRANSASGDGILSLEPPGDESPDVYAYDPAMPNLSQGGHSCCWLPPTTPMGPACQAASEAWPHVLVYTSRPLETDLELLGDVTVTLHAGSTATDTDFTARLCVVDEGGRSTNLQEGIVRARFRKSLTDPVPLLPSRITEYRIHLGPVGIRVPLGHRLRVDVSSSDFPQWDRNLNTGRPPGIGGPSAAVVATNAIFHDSKHPSRITLPVVS